MQKSKTGFAQSDFHTESDSLTVIILDEEFSMRMADRFGIITAGASGMGRAGALRFAAEGAAVAVVDLNEAQAQEVAQAIIAAGGQAFALAGNLMEEDFARGIVHETKKRFGKLDFVWAHAGHPSVSRIEGLDLHDFDEAMNLNVRAVLASVIEAIPIMRERGGGSGVEATKGADGGEAHAGILVGDEFRERGK